MTTPTTRQRPNYVFGVLTSALTNSDTTLSSTSLTRLPSVDSTGYCAITLSDTAGNYEIVWVTAHTGGASTATIVRGQEASTARAWPSSSTWSVAPTAKDFDAVRYTSTLTTGSLADQARASSTVLLGRTFTALRATADRAARLRLYSTAAKQSADLSRAITTTPTGDHGLLLDVVTTASLLTVDLFGVTGFDGKSTPDGLVPITVDNLSGSTSTVTVSLLHLRLEA